MDVIVGVDMLTAVCGLVVFGFGLAVASVCWVVWWLEKGWKVSCRALSIIASRHSRDGLGVEMSRG